MVLSLYSASCAPYKDTISPVYQRSALMQNILYTWLVTDRTWAVCDDHRLITSSTIEQWYIYILYMTRNLSQYLWNISPPTNNIDHYWRGKNNVIYDGRHYTFNRKFHVTDGVVSGDMFDSDWERYRLNTPLVLRVIKLWSSHKAHVLSVTSQVYNMLCYQRWNYDIQGPG